MKPNGDIRLYVDYRALNKATKPDNYHLPRIDWLKASIKSKYFTTIDLKDGFYQIPVHKDSIPLTAMSVYGGSYEYVRMSFGLRNAPPTFQRFMDIVLRGLKGMLAYIDDIVIYSDTLEEHLASLEELFAVAAKYGLNIN